MVRMNLFAGWGWRRRDKRMDLWTYWEERMGRIQRLALIYCTRLCIKETDSGKLMDNRDPNLAAL